MRKLIFVLLLFLIPTVVLAANTCNPNDLSIETVTLSKTVGNAEEVTAASVDNQKINLDVKLNDPNDYMEYKIIVKNNSTEDYYIKDEDIADNQFLKYEFVHENNEYLIEPNSEKEITLRVSYKNRVDGSANYTSTDTLSLNVLSNQMIEAGNTLKNISIGLAIFIVVIILLIICGVITIANNKKSRDILMLLIALAIFIPISANAACESSIDVDVKIELDSKNAIFDTGTNINVLMKTLAGTTITNGAFTHDETVTAFKKSSTEPESANKNVASSSTSEYPIYVWYENGTIWWWSEDDTPSLGVDGSYFFAGFDELTSIDGATTFDSSNSTNLSNLFPMCGKLADYTPVSNWNTSSNTNLDYSFYGSYINDLEYLRNWDVSKVTTFDSMFLYADNFSSVEALENWNTSSAENFNNLFSFTRIQSLDGLDDWDVSHVQFFNYTFNYIESLVDIEGVRKWNTESALEMKYLIDCCTQLESIAALENWDVSHVTDMEYAFNNNPALLSLEGLEKWNTESLKSIKATFGYIPLLTSLEPLRNWDVSKVTTMAYAFNHDTGLTSIEPIEGWTTTSLASTESMFVGDNNILSADLRNWDDTKLSNTAQMFNGCTRITEINLTGWDTPSLTGSGMMFYNCNNLTKIYGIEHINTSKITYFPGMFYGCSKITSLDLHEWNTEKVIEMNSMFNNCTSLTEVNVLGWNTARNTTLANMFRNTALTTIDISSFDTKKVKNFNEMFNLSTHLTTIYIGEDWDTSANTKEGTNVFASSTSLPNFSTSNENYRSLAWAKPTTQGGYLTLKTNS